MIPVFEGVEASVELASRLCIAGDEDTPVKERVESILQAVRTQGDSALAELAIRFNDPAPALVSLEDPSVQQALSELPTETKSLLDKATGRIRDFAQAVMNGLQPVRLDQGGFSVGMDYRPVERAACYVPGGRYPLPSTALMTTITAQVAGVQEIYLVSPSFQPEILYAASLGGVKGILRMGGAQAIAAVAYGTETVPKADLVVGPGNAYVTEAKRQLQGVIGIDMLAGPSEVTILADEQANPRWIAADLLAQAEHDPDARVYLFTPSRKLAVQVQEAISALAGEIALPLFIEDVLSGSGLFVFDTMAECVDAVNRIAPEHLELHVREPEALKAQLKHYGALFMGYSASVPFGDYMAGPNHTLPTGRTARFSGGLGPLTFLRPQSWIWPHDNAVSLASDTAHFATLEGLHAHAQAARERLKHT